MSGPIQRTHTCATCVFSEKIGPDMVECHGPNTPNSVPMPDPAKRSVTFVGVFPRLPASQWCSNHPRLSGKVVLGASAS